MVEGLILKESLLSDRVFDLVEVLKTERWEDVPTAVSGQPTTWNAVRVELERPKLPAVLQVLEEDLKSEPLGWYADFSDEDEKFVVFPGKTFQFGRDGREAAIRFGLSLGIPRAQLDFK